METQKKYKNYLIFLDSKLYTSVRDAANYLNVKYTTLKSHLDRNMGDAKSYSFFKFGHYMTVKINDN
jgi:hypothetical protein